MAFAGIPVYYILVFWEAFWEPSVAFAGIPVYYVFSLLGKPSGSLPWPLRVFLYTTF